MGVVFARFEDDDRIIAVAKNSERGLEAAAAEPAAETDSPAAPAEAEPEAGAAETDPEIEKDEPEA